MARPIPVEYPDAVYHVTARGNQGKAIYREDHDRERFLSSLVEREVDRCVAIWLRVHAGPERMTKVAAEYGYKDGSGVHQVVKRLGGKGEERSSTLSPPDCACRRCVKQELTPPSTPAYPVPYPPRQGQNRRYGGDAKAGTETDGALPGLRPRSSIRSQAFTDSRIGSTPTTTAILGQGRILPDGHLVVGRVGDQ